MQPRMLVALTTAPASVVVRRGWNSARATTRLSPPARSPLFRLSAVTSGLFLILAACDDEQPVAPPSPGRLALQAEGAVVRAANATVTDLGGLPDFVSHLAIGINAGGSAVGWGTPNGCCEAALSFDPPTVLYREENYPFDAAGRAYSINDIGVIAGVGSQNFRETVFAGPGPEGWLPPLPDAQREYGGYVNNAGEVAGTSWFDPNRVTPGHGTVWVPGQSGYSPVDLGTFNGQTVEVLGIAPNLSGADRIIVGRYAAATFNGYTALMWRNAEWIELPAPPNCDLNYTEALDVSDTGIPVGVENYCGYGAVLWEDGALRSLDPECVALGLGGGSAARGIAITPSGRILIVGRCVGRPVVWYGDGAGGYVCELLPLLEGDTGGDAYDVNPSGQIVGQSGNHAVRWTFTLPNPNEPPTADAGDAYTADEGMGVGFDGSRSFDPDGDPLIYDWDFGDGSAHGFGATPVHVYADNGTYSVTLTVDDGHGGVDVASTTASIGNVRPQVNAGAPSSIQSGQTLNFSGTITDAGAADTPSSWTLDWGDGTAPLTGSAPVPGSVLAAHTYYGTGTFTLQLAVTDKDGAVGTGRRTVTVDPRSVMIAASPDPVSLSEKRTKEIHIVIFSTSELDATQVDPATLSVGDGNDPDALPLRRKNGAYVLSMRDVNRDGLSDLGFSVEKLNPNLGLAPPSTTLVVRGAVPTSSGAIVVRGSTTIAVSP